MIVMNTAMRSIIDNLGDERNLALPKQLQDIINLGFKRVDGGVFFEYFMSDLKKLNIDFIKAQYIDLSGYEFSVNKFHIEDYCTDNRLGTAMLFLSEFEKKWSHKIQGITAIVIIGYELSSEFGEICTFTFHQNRLNQTVINSSEVENFPNAIFIAGVTTENGL
jgi:hypothetical protein